MPTPPASKAQVDAMAGALDAYLFGPGGFASELAPKDRELLKHTERLVLDAPSAAMLTSVGATGADAHLLGLFTTPHPTIRIFANEIIATGYDAQDVFDHELGHRLHFDHDLRAARMPIIHSDSAAMSMCMGPHDAIGHPMGAAALAVMERPQPRGCRLCHLYGDTSHVVGLLEDLRTRAYLAAQPHELPLATGGTIPLMRRELACAQLDLLAAQSGPLAGRSGEVASMARLLNAAQHKLTGILEPESISQAVPAAIDARSAAYDVVWGYYLRTGYANSPEMRLSDSQLYAAFRP